MKNLLIGTLTVLTLFAACKKEDHPTTPSGTTYPVQIDVSGFERTSTPMGGRTAATENIDAAKGNIHYILYTVWDANTQRAIKNIYQTSKKDTGFGRILDTLAAGRYFISIIGAKDSLFNAQSSGGFYNRLPGSDIFYGRMELSVSGAVNQTLTLNRVVTKLVVHLKDRIPYNTTTLTVGVDGMQNRMWPWLKPFDGQLTPGINNSYSWSYSYLVPDSLKGKRDVTLPSYMLTLNSFTTDVTISGNDANNVSLGYKTIRSVIFENNKITYLSGNLFDGAPGGDGMIVTVDPAWKTDSIKATF
ncbi:hypothetical protein [Chitinophaga nivalis]|uniref:FimB/Mfa2 family fimbrial subunit n=1 Tax=Chitinophaga nivalis TaxID=2991709 RepID=A0ABT3IM12_9BACT|nr:hypothetical protein [Chitinophaga nivalis]MCW3465294.1 hypothetical protein [Chitinophaga nivalis]MCW3485014.1 hypothetical protein [Chitinophaga nivalis]